MQRVIMFEDGWDVQINDDYYINQTEEGLSDIMMRRFSEGDTLIISHELTLDTSQMAFPCVLVEMNRTYCTVYINGMEIYDSNYAWSDEAWSAPGFCFVDIPGKYYKGSVLRIEITALDGYVFRKPMPIMIGDGSDVFSTILHLFSFPLCTTIFLIMFGGIMLLLCLLLYPFYERINIVLYSALSMMLVGLWGTCDFHFATLAISPQAANALQYTSLFAAIGVFYLIIDSLFNVSVKYVLKAVGWGLIVIAILSLILQSIQVINQSEFFFFYIILSVVALLILLVIDVRQLFIDRCTITVGINLVSLTTFVLCLDGSMIVTSYLTNSELGTNPILTRLFPMGAIIYILGQITNYILFMSQSLGRSTHNEQLAQIAYTDDLTRINNRASYAQKSMELDDKDEDYCIISFDMDGLKPINDRFGHFAGDKALSDFAMTLRTVFEGYYCARIGGDEFVVIMENADMATVATYVAKYNEAMGKLNAMEPDIKHRASYGYAFRDEMPPDKRTVHDTFLFADQRMYMRKEIQKKLDKEQAMKEEKQ